MSEEKCLVTEAMDKCQCEMCKLARQARQISVDIIEDLKLQRIWIDALKEAKII